VTAANSARGRLTVTTPDGQDTYPAGHWLAVSDGHLLVQAGYVDSPWLVAAYPPGRWIFGKADPNVSR